MIRTAQESDIPRLKQIWQVCFGDSDSYIDFFFQNAFRPESTLLLEEDGLPCSMFFLLDSTLVLKGHEYPAAYLYAAATLPEYRGHGYMGQLIRYAGRFCAERGWDYIVLVPAEKELWAYYSKFGFLNGLCMSVDSWTGTGQKSLPDLSGNQPDALSLERTRAEVLTQCGGLLWKGEQFRYVLAEHRFTDGRIFQTSCGYALYHVIDGLCRIDELMALPGCDEELRRALISAVPAERYEAFRPYVKGAGEQVPRGMFLPLRRGLPSRQVEIGSPYMGLTLG